MAGKTRHLLFREGRYYARLVVPKDLRSYIGKIELRTPLGADRRTALSRHPGAVAELQHRIALAEREAAKENGTRVELGRYPLATDQIAFRNYQDRLAQDEALRNQGPQWASVSIDDGFVAQLRRGVAGQLTDEELTELVGHRIDRFRQIGNTTAEQGTSEWRSLARAICISELEALSRVAERDEGNFAGKPEHPLIANAAPIADEAPPVSIRGLFDEYLKQLERNGQGREARRRWTPVFTDLVSHLRHDDATRVTKQNIMQWRDAKAATLAPKTIRDVYLASARAVFRWAVENDRLRSNPAADVKVKVAKPKRTREKGFRDDEALAILKACRAYARPQREAPQTAAAKRWASLLCAFTGARITEITQLRKQDIRQEGDVTVIRITPDAGSVKTREYRDIPAHQQLIDLGFMDFVKEAPAGSLFHAGKPGKELQGARTTSGRVSEWLQSLKLIPEGIPPNHGWRHRFKTIGRELEISDRVLDAIQGHAAKTAGDDYGDVTIAAKKRAIDKLPWFLL